MDGQQLHDVVLGRLGARRELVELFGVIEPGQQRRQRSGLVGGQERVHLVDERAQLCGGDACGPAGLVGGQLHVQPQLELDHAHEFRDGNRRAATQPREHRRGLTQPFARRRSEAGEPAVIVGDPQKEVERVDERSALVAR